MKPTIKSSKTPAIIVAEITMMSASFKGAHFLVEGDDDSRFWKCRLDRNNISIVDCEGKINLLGACRNLAFSKGINFFGVYDADFDLLLRKDHKIVNAEPTDETDLAIVLMQSSAMERVLAEYEEQGAAASFKTRHDSDIRRYIFQIGARFGRLRYINEVNGHNVCFDSLSPYRFIATDTWILDEAALTNEYAKLAGISLTTLMELTSDIPACLDREICQGHDAVKIFTIGLKKVLGKKQISEQDLFKALRLAYAKEELVETRMHRAIVAWSRNQGLSITC